MMATPANPSVVAAVNVIKASVRPRANVAALLTCHNRREKTVACLDRLFAQDCLGPQGRGGSEVIVDVFLVDDGSRDGTAQTIREKFPQVAIAHGPGNLFWAGGMRLAWRTAVQARKYDAYLLLNDDTLLRPDALRSLMRRVGIITAARCGGAGGGLSFRGRVLENVICSTVTPRL
jgi:glycosyltransferase involved in cell wall biosynthesis